MRNNKELLLVHPSMKPVSLTEAVNVMLPPQFYTLKKEVLPIRYTYQAKRIAPSLFEGLLEEGKQYDYMVWKEEDAWVFLAYDLETIKTFLESKGFTPEHVSKLFFAQQSVALFDKPLLLGDNEALLSLDDMVVVVPREALDEEEPSLVFDNRFTPKKGVVLPGAYGSVLGRKQAILLAAVFALFALMFFVEGWRYGNNIKAEEAELQQLIEAYPSLQSTYKRDSILAKYRTIDTAERKKRDTVKMVSELIFKGVILTSFEMNDKKFSVHFACKDAQVAKRVKTLAQKHQLKATAVAGSNDVKIEGVL